VPEAVSLSQCLPITNHNGQIRAIAAGVHFPERRYLGISGPPLFSDVATSQKLPSAVIWLILGSFGIGPALQAYTGLERRTQMRQLSTHHSYEELRGGSWDAAIILPGNVHPVPRPLKEPLDKALRARAGRS
jgi:hypothetical protein